MIDSRTIVLLAVLAPACSHTVAGEESQSISGAITDERGNALPGIMVTIRHQTSGIEITKFTNPEGHYTFASPLDGPQVVTVKARGRKHASTTLPGRNREPAVVDFRLQRNPQSYRDLSGAELLTLLPDGERKRELLLTCTGCHQLDYARLTQYGPLNDEAGWRGVFPKMRAFDLYDLIPPDFDEREYARWLAEHLNERAVTNIAVPERVAPEVARARYTEYPVPNLPALPHDLVVGPDGRIWITAFLNDAIWALDPDTGDFESFPVNENPGAAADVRALEFDRTGNLWIVLGRTKAIVKLDPGTGAYQTFDIGMYAHSLALDSRNRVWFNGYFSKPEQIGSLDPSSGAISLFDIPSANLSQEQGLPLPYGLLVDKHDTVWNTTLAGNTLVSFAIATGSSQLYRMPTANSGPRRPAIGPDGLVWIPAYAAGKLVKFDPSSERYTEYDTGLSSLGPYDVEINQRTGIVWMSGTQNSSVLRFDPDSETFLEYPWPTRPGYVRHIAVDHRTGDVWSAYAAFPEDNPKIVRLQPGMQHP